MKGEQDLLTFYNNRYFESLQGLKRLGEGQQTSEEYRQDRVRREVT